MLMSVVAGCMLGSDTMTMAYVVEVKPSMKAEYRALRTYKQGGGAGGFVMLACCGGVEWWTLANGGGRQPASWRIAPASWSTKV